MKNLAQMKNQRKRRRRKEKVLQMKRIA